MGERYRTVGIWQFPQGGVEPELSLEDNVYKELEEEIGLTRDVVTIEKKLNATFEYDFLKPPDYAVGKWRGQAQTFWLVSFHGAESDIVLDAHSPEFQSWRWCTVAEVKELAEPRRLRGYLAPLAEFEEYIQNV